MLSKNFKDIVEDFDVVLEVQVKGTSVTVQGILNKRDTEFEYSYKHNEVAKEVAKKVSYFKNI